MLPLPRIEKMNGHSRLMVDGKPFLILGLQWDCDSCFSKEEMNPLFAHARKMGANTAALPLYWREIEPEPDRFDFAMLQERINQAEKYDLRLVLLWFATWKNASSFYAPEFIRNNPDQYPPAQAMDGSFSRSLCPSQENTWKRDCNALRAVMEYLREHDSTRRVILFQIENEPGIMDTARCHCPACNAKFSAEAYEQKYPKMAAEAFSAVSIASYIDRLAGEAKKIYDIPMYLNVWMSNPVGSIAGRDYPSGGAVPQVLDIYYQQINHIDLVAPDIYKAGYREFQYFAKAYANNGNPLYVAEHSSSLIGRAECNVFYAIGQHEAIGFDPWAIDSPHPERESHPLVDPVDGEWGPQAYWLRDSYVAIGRAILPVIEAQGTSRLFTFVQDFPAETGTAWEADGCDVMIDYKSRDHSARGMVIQISRKEFIVLGVGFEARFRAPRPDGRPVPLHHTEWGRFDHEEWISHHPIRRQPLESAGFPVIFLEPGVVRVILA